MRRLLNHRWLTKGGLCPVDPSSKFDGQTIDEEILVEMSIQLGWERPDLRNELLDWKFNAITATYLLLQLRKVSSRSARIIDIIPLREFIRNRFTKTPKFKIIKKKYVLSIVSKRIASKRTKRQKMGDFWPFSRRRCL